MKKLTDHRKDVLGHYARQLEKILVILSGLITFGYFWFTFFNSRLDEPFQNKGNVLILGLYLVLQVTFLYVVGGLKIGVYRKRNVILSQFIGYFLVDAVEVLILILMVGRIARIRGLIRRSLIMYLIQVALAVALTLLLELLFHNLYRPKQMMILYESKMPLRLQGKIQTRTDQFEIVGSMKVEENWREELGRRRQETWFKAVLLQEISSPRRNDILKFCYQYNLQCYLVPKISDVLVRSADDVEIFDTPILYVKEYGMTYGQGVIKRFFDILFSALGIALTSPIMLITAIAIKAHDHGPVIFSQERCTKNKKTFRIYKFRSMVVDAEKDGVARLATEKDDRITSVGRFIRKTRIDELPQFFNILKGDMSIVGPRPERPEIIEEYMKNFPEFAYRLKAKAGLTGYAQVYGKYNTTAYDKLKLDLYYVQRYSLWLDVRLVLMTIKIIFLKESTEGLEEGERIAASEHEEKGENAGIVKKES
ncbi:MAG: sugar transferase [Lachnospiraceae bacterium]|nr:sugar transferase [Lachnospiraceae bacterium]